MQILYVTFFFLFSSSSTQAQQNSNFKQRVNVINWKSRAVLIIEEIWNSAKNQIVQQIGEEKYHDVRKNYDWKSIPSQMTIMDGNRRRSVSELHNKLDSLKIMNRIATFDVYLNGSKLEKKSIIEVPYRGNEGWDNSAKWTVIYFILDNEDIQDVN